MVSRPLLDADGSLRSRPEPSKGEALGEADSWRGHALCRGLGAELFFPVGEVGPDALAQAENGKAVCRRCPVREPCLDFSLVTNQGFGVWGGLTAEERRFLRRTRRIRGQGRVGAQPGGSAQNG